MNSISNGIPVTGVSGSTQTLGFPVVGRSDEGDRVWRDGSRSRSLTTIAAALFTFTDPDGNVVEFWTWAVQNHLNAD